VDRQERDKLFTVTSSASKGHHMQLAEVRRKIIKRRWFFTR